MLSNPFLPRNGFGQVLTTGGGMNNQQPTNSGVDDWLNPWQQNGVSGINNTNPFPSNRDQARPINNPTPGSPISKVPAPGGTPFGNMNGTLIGAAQTNPGRFGSQMIGPTRPGGGNGESPMPLPPPPPPEPVPTTPPPPPFMEPTPPVAPVDTRPNSHDWNSQNNMTREQYRDRLFSTNPHNLDQLKAFLSQYGGRLLSDSGQTETPYGDVLDLLIGAKTGNGQAGWTNNGGGMGSIAPTGAAQQPTGNEQYPGLQELINYLMKNNTGVTGNTGRGPTTAYTPAMFQGNQTPFNMGSNGSNSPFPWLQ